LHESKYFKDLRQKLGVIWLTMISMAYIVNQIMYLVNGPDAMIAEITKWLTSLPIVLGLLFMWIKKDFTHYEWFFLCLHVRIIVVFVKSSSILLEKNENERV